MKLFSKGRFPLALPLLAAILFAGCAVRPAYAQFIGYTSPQTVQQTLAAPGTACTGSAQTFVVMNLGQTQHYAQLIPSPSVIGMEMVIEGTDVLGNTVIISDPVFPSPNTLATTAVTGSGYYPKISIVVTCASAVGTFNLTYSGTSSTPNVVSGSFLLSQIDKNIFSGASQGSNITSTAFTTPWGHTAGQLNFAYLTGAIAGSALQVNCLTAVANFTIVNAPIANALGAQTFTVPDRVCPQITVQYQSGGASANTFNLEYTPQPPGVSTNSTLGSYSHITGTTATAVKATTGNLISVNVNTPAVGTISIFDLATASCTGTPATNTVAVITATATAPFGPFPYNVQMLNGICVKASAAMDFTVSFQ